MKELLVNEIFETIQGEGSYTGTPSIFVRLQGCPVGCSWCDTKHTWDILPENRTDSIEVINKTQESPTHFAADVDGLLTLFKQQGYSATHVVITGGEPCMYDLTDFTTSLHNSGYTSQIETSGTFEVKCDANTWVTLSPKIDMKARMPVLSQAMQRANEIKHPVAMQKHVDQLDELLNREFSNTENAQRPVIFLQPISQLQRATDLAVATCIKRNWRLSVQLHKYIGVE